jgi:hypothetical protein
MLFIKLYKQHNKDLNNILIVLNKLQSNVKVIFILKIDIQNKMLSVVLGN